MSALGSRLIQSAQQALAYASGAASDGSVVHKMVDVKPLRARMGQVPPEFAARFGLSVGTVRNWEQGRAVPDRPAQILLRGIEAEPEMVWRVLRGRVGMIGEAG